MAKIKSLLKINGNDNYVYATLNGIDTNNILYEGSITNNAFTYKASEDCVMYLIYNQDMLWYNDQKIDDVLLFPTGAGAGAGNHPYALSIPLKKGQVFSHQIRYTVYIKIYGIKR